MKKAVLAFLLAGGGFVALLLATGQWETMTGGGEPPEEPTMEEQLAERRQAYHDHWKEVQAERQKGVDRVKDARLRVRLRERKRQLGY